MKIAIPVWQGRISPLLDAATQVLVAELCPGGHMQREHHPLRSPDALGRASELAALGVEVVLCGAVSQGLARALAAAGVLVVAFLCGPVEEVLEAWLTGSLLRHPSYTMPGCRGWRQRARWRIGMPKEMGRGAGCRGAQAGGKGKMGGPKSAGPGGECVCPHCGERVPHVAGQPCRDLSCPKCGTPMTRA